MIVKHEPSHDLMNLYLESFVEQAIELQENSILLRNINGNVIETNYIMFFDRFRCTTIV